MSKTLKKFVIFFILLCVIFIVVYAIEFFVVNNDSDPSSDPSHADTSPPDFPSTSPNPTPTSDSSQNSPIPPSANSNLFEIPIPGGKTLTLIADRNLFDYDILDSMGNLFTYTGDDTASLEISFIENSQAIMLAPSFLDNYIDYTGGEFFIEGESKIASSNIHGDLVIAKNNGVAYEAWLVDIDGGVLAFVINYHNDNIRDDLINILDSLEIIAA